MWKWAGLLLVILGAGSCASFEKQLANDVAASATHKLDRCEIEGFVYKGVDGSLQKPQILKVLMIHGVGTHHPGYSLILQEKLANNIGFDVMSRVPKNISLLDPKLRTPVGNLRITYWQNRDASKKMMFYELTWSEITTPYKKMLSFDVTEQSSEFRVPFNNTMKKFLDNVLPDPMIYLVDPHQLITNSGKQSLCWMLKTDWETIPNGKAEVCHIGQTEEVKALADQNIMFVTHSLGSEIVMNTIVDVANGIAANESGALLEPGYRQALQKLQNKEINLFMMANQLPILMIAKPLPRVHNQQRSYCSPGGKNYHRRVFKGTNIIAFSDPNDILSYTIPQSFADEYIDSRICPLVTNVSINVAPEISAFGIGVVNPVEAHTYYERDNKVINLITHGTFDIEQNKILDEQCHFVKMRNDYKFD